MESGLTNKWKMCMSLTECNSGTAQKFPLINTTIALKNIKNCIRQQWGISLPLLSVLNVPLL